MEKLNINLSNKISAHQVIISLVDAVKELLENSIDAKSTKIDIRLKNYGADLIEVIDNGCGILENEIELITKRHSTSKISKFDDLEIITSFGYRGEALHSLCLLGNVELHTRHETSEMGILIKFDQFGQIIKSKKMARGNGCTVRIRQLFERIPIRRRRILSKARLEVTQIVNLVIGYCIASSQASITCSTIDGQGNVDAILVSGGGSRSANKIEPNGNSEWIKKNIQSVLAIPDLNKVMFQINYSSGDLIPLEVLSEFSVTQEFVSSIKLGIEGWMQNPHATNKGNKDTTVIKQQYIIINGRPSISKKLTKLINDTYQSVVISTSRPPGFIIVLTVSSGLLDVNLCPDKRTVMFRQEAAVKAIVKSAVIAGLKSANSSTHTQLIGPSLTSLSGVTIIERVRTQSQQYSSCQPYKISCLHKNPFMKLESLRKIQVRQKFDMRHLKSLERINISNTGSNVILTGLTGDNDIEDNNGDTLNISSDLLINEADRGEQLAILVCQKSDFRTARVLGQFNKGFIVAQLASGDQMIVVDQHAADERFRLETIQKQCITGNVSGFGQSGRLIPQPLVRPETIRLNYDDYVTADLHKDLLFELGFRIEFVDDSDYSTVNHVIMKAAPCRDGLVLDRDDLLSLLAKLGDLSNSNSGDCQQMASVDASTAVMMIPKLRSKLEYNACRSAIMVGTTLTHSSMKQILNNLSGLRYPWICAHGRPTLRHLCTLTELKLE